jgi:hypothetical protein
MDDPRYPLSWPPGWRRTRADDRTRAKFGMRTGAANSYGVNAINRVSVAEAVGRVRHELRLMGVDESELHISTNLVLRSDGNPRSDRGEPGDPGAAVYWTQRKKSQCMAIDIYDRVADNLAALAATLEALRAIERHGGAFVMERAFTGFAALPASIKKPWREVLQFGRSGEPLSTKLTEDSIDAHYKRLAKVRHPEAGGKLEDFLELVEARDEALLEVSHS